MEEHREEEKKRGAAAPPPLPTGAPQIGTEVLPAARAGGLLARLGLGQGAIEQGLVAGLSKFFSSNVVMLLMATAVAGACTYGIYSAFRPQSLARIKKAVGFPQPSYDAAATKDLPTEGRGPSALQQFRSANQGALGSGENQGQQAASADPAQPQAEPAAPQPADEAAAGPSPDAALAEAKKLADKAQAAGGTGGGAGTGAGMMAGVGPLPSQPNPAALDAASLLAKAERGFLEASRADVVAGRAGARAALSRGRGSRGAMGQLRATNALSQTATQMGGASASAYTASQPFDGGSAISAGGGASVTGSGAGSGTSGGGTGVGQTESGPIGPSGGSSGQSQAPPVEGTDVTPWSSMVMMAVSMLMIASMIIMMIGIITKVEKTSAGLWPPLKTVLTGWKKTLYMIAIGLAAMATLMGLMIASMYGQQAQGMILTVAGGITTAMAALAFWKPFAKPAILTIIAGIAGIAGSIGAMLAGGSGIGGG